jgi:hypothetical protein
MSEFDEVDPDGKLLSRDGEPFPIVFDPITKTYTFAGIKFEMDMPLEVWGILARSVDYADFTRRASEIVAQRLEAARLVIPVNFFRFRINLTGSKEER